MCVCWLELRRRGKDSIGLEVGKDCDALGWREIGGDRARRGVEEPEGEADDRRGIPCIGEVE